MSLFAQALAHVTIINIINTYDMSVCIKFINIFTENKNKCNGNLWFVFPSIISLDLQTPLEGGYLFNKHLRSTHRVQDAERCFLVFRR